MVRQGLVNSCFAVFCLFVALAVGGCNLTGQESESTESVEDVQTQDSDTSASETPVVVDESASSLCDNPYYLVDPSKIRKYKLTSQVPDGNREFTLKQKLVDDNTFAEIRSYSSGLVVSVNWNCLDDGLRAAEYLNQVQMAVGSGQMETIEGSGISIPSEWELGNEWSSSYKVKTSIEAGPVKAEADGTVTLEHKLAAVDEKIKVAGGEFETARIDTVIRIELQMRGTRIPAKEFKTTIWVSPKVGIVKQTASGGFGEEQVEFLGFE
ncbi:MAG: hypothetical protein DWQ47_13605 [Acidobacteria bacterium]|nr:MAG: hypothetical protein DWQ32_01005 [Acidobacteriota bacterium]REK02890.1 MAG: hypothetical protein DWQ38_11130 [Acidobacteriota bacterium]REK13306.1 MAG: hypothetical protein DWQ43_06695 [Acidobacteriota bacterium]REK41300.1 MAG: hypothetical protein DWQ47_13605 [Acidobacteriota bacterium]